MTPFGLFLESVRRSRQLQQAQLADRIGVTPCYVSAIESGKKGPPSKDVIGKLVEKLELTQGEQNELLLCVEQSKKTLRLPENATTDEYLLVADLRHHLGALSIEQINIIRNALRLGSEKPNRPRIEVRSC